MRINSLKKMRHIFALGLAVFTLGMNVLSAQATSLTTQKPESEQGAEAEDAQVIVAEQELLNPLIVVDSYEVTNEKIVPGEDFSLTLVLKNHNKSQDATGVLIDISNPEGVAPVYGTVSQLYVGDLKAGESKKIVIDYNSWTTITSPTLDFNVTIVTDTNQNYVVLRIPAGSDSPFSILSGSAPSEIEVNDIATVSLTFKVLGEEAVRDVVLTATSNGELIGSSQIGIITPGITKTQQLLVSFNSVGEQAIDLGLEYVDETGQKQTVSVITTFIKVLEKEVVPQEPIPGDAQDNEGVQNILLMGISGMVILVVFLAIIMIIKKNK